jgi:hypothetical protein
MQALFRLVLTWLGVPGEKALTPHSLVVVVGRLRMHLPFLLPGWHQCWDSPLLRICTANQF